LYQIKQNEKTFGNQTSSARPWETAEQRNRYSKNILIQSHLLWKSPAVKRTTNCEKPEVSVTWHILKSG